MEIRKCRTSPLWTCPILNYVNYSIMSPVKPTLVTFVAVALTWLAYFGLFSYEVLVLEDWHIVLVAIGALGLVAPLSTIKK